MPAPPVPPVSPTPRRIGLPRWLDARLIAGLVLVLASVGIGARVVAGAQSRTQLVAFARDLAAGTTVRPDDVIYVRANLPTKQSSVYVDRLAGVLGQQLDRAVVRGELATRASVHRSDASTTVVLPLASGNAPELSRGQRIVVWAAANGCPLGELVAEATVQGVDRGADGSFESAGGQRVTLDLPDDTASRVVTTLAQDGVTLRAGVLRGAPRASARSMPPSTSPVVPAAPCKA